MSASVEFSTTKSSEAPATSWDDSSAPATALPDYLVDTYTWAYVAPKMVDFLDREPIVAAILWGQHNRLMRAARAPSATRRS